MAQAKTYQTRFQDKAKAAKYARRFDLGRRRKIDQREQRAVAKIFGALDGCRTVLDVPSGAGRFAATLAGNGRQVIESDVAREILEHARQKNVPLSCVQANAARLPFRDQAVDCIFCNRLLHHILKPEERLMFLREFHRVSRRWLVISFFDYHAFGLLRRALKKLKGRTTKYAQEPTAPQFAAEVAAAGFRLREAVPTGPVWVAERYWVLEKL